MRLGRYWIIALFVLVLAIRRFMRAAAERARVVSRQFTEVALRSPGAGGNGVSPTQALVPAATRLPEGTPITIRLGAQASSASAQPEHL